MIIFSIALMFLTSVILVVALTYIILTNQSKKTLALLEKGLDPKDYIKDRFFLNTAKAGMFLLGAGLGFLLAVLIDEYVLIGIDNPGIYPACIFICTGISLVIYYKIFDGQEPR